MNKENEFEKIKQKAQESEEKHISENESEETPRESQATKIVRLIENPKEHIELFHDEMKKAYIVLSLGGHKEVWLCESKEIKQWISRKYWETYHAVPGSEAVKSAISILIAKACFDGEEKKLHIRVARDADTLWYDLTNSQWEAIKITREGWSLEKSPPRIFKRFHHQKSQVLPERGGDLRDFLQFVNISNEEHQLLLMVSIVSSFIPGFPHPAIFIHGVQGSAKSTLSKLLRTLVDPSQIEAAEMPRSLPDFVQLLSHHWLLNFDNISTLSQERSDLLCKAITGTGFSKRELYSNDSDIIYKIQACITLNGINLPASSPDLLERGFIVELTRIPPSERRDEEEFYREFEKLRPRILGGIFSTLSQTLVNISSVSLDEKFRMADFTKWGCAISQALGYSQEAFLTAYRHNIEEQNMNILNDSPVASTLMELMEEKNIWEGTATQLLNELRDIADTHQMDMGVYSGFPKVANQLTKKLNRLKPNLWEIGIEIQDSRKNKERTLSIKKHSQTEKDVREVFADVLIGDDSDDSDDTNLSF